MAPKTSLEDKILYQMEKLYPYPTVHSKLLHILQRNGTAAEIILVLGDLHARGIIEKTVDDGTIYYGKRKFRPVNIYNLTNKHEMKLKKNQTLNGNTQA